MDVVAVVGPTAAGKSEYALRVAEERGGEVVNADSMQLYEGMDVGTAKLSVAERRGVPHHLLDVYDVTETSTVADYQRRARAVVADCHARGVLPVFAGGSGLYLRAALDDLDFAGTDPALRASLEAELETLGAQALHARLGTVDPAAAAAILPTNGRRIVRALEVVALTGKPFPGAMTTYRSVYDVEWIGLDVPDLDERIERRVAVMWERGLVDEVRGLAARGLREGRTASRALGYRQVLAYLDGEYGEREAAERTVAATRRFARRQRSWFRRDPRVRWEVPTA